VTLSVDGKIVGKWSTTGKVEVNGTIYSTDSAAPMAPPLMEKPQ
jgi:hypothetical protein